MFASVFKRRKFLLAGAAVLWLLCLWLASGVKLEEDLFKLLPDRDPEIASFRQLLSAFELMDSMFIAVGAEQGSPINAAGFLAEKMRKSDLFNSITLEWRDDDVLTVMDILRRHRADFFSESAKSGAENKLRPEALKAKFSHWKRLLTETPAPVLADTFRNDPVGLDAFLLEKLKAMKAFSGKMQVKGGRLFSKDGGNLLIMARPAFPASDIKRSEKLVEFMDTAIGEAERKYSSEKLRVSWLAGHRFSVENARKMKLGLMISISISITSILILALLIYRRPLLALLNFLPVLFGGAAALALTRLIYPEVSAIAIGCGSLLVGITVDYGIHVCYHADQLRGESIGKDSLIKLLKKLSGPLSMGALTTVAAFLVLQFSVLPGYRQLSVFAAAGVLAAAIFALLVLPLLIPLKPGFGFKRPVLRISDIFPVIFRWLANHRIAAGIFILLFTGFAVAGTMRLKFEGDLRHMNAASPEIERDRQQIVGAFGDPLASVSVVVAGKTAGEAFQSSEELLKVLKNMESRGNVTSVTSISILLPGPRTVKSNRQRWKKFWSKEQISRTKKSISMAAEDNGFVPEAFTPFYESVANVPAEPLGLEDFRQTVFADIFRNLIGKSGSGETMIMTRAALSPEFAFDEFRKQLESRFPGVIVYRGTAMVAYIMKLIYREIYRIALIAFAVIVILLWLYHRNFKMTGVNLLPLLLSLIWSFGMMGWFGVKINLMNCVISIFVFGLVVDYSIFLVSAKGMSGNGGYLSHTGGAIAFSALTTMFGLGAMLFGLHPAFVSLGFAATLGIGGGFLAVVLTVPALLPGNFVKITN